jgi:hypothetical protein
MLCIGNATGVQPDGTILTNNFSSAPPGTRITKWNGQTQLGAIPDGTSQTILIGEKFVRLNSLNGKNEDRSIFSSMNANNYQRNLGTDGTTNWVLVGDINATAAPVNACFGGPHPGICMFVMGDGAVKPIRTSIDVTNLTRLGSRKDGQVITNGLD